MRRTLTLTLVLLLALAGGCKQAETESATVESQKANQPAAQAAELTPEQLGELGAQIRKEPARANEILRARGLDEKTFEIEIRKITENPEASQRYAAAYRKASGA